MGLFTWIESRMRVFRWYDISLIKLSTAAFVLMIAKLWEPLLALEWHWYLVISIIAGIRPIRIMFGKR